MISRRIRAVEIIQHASQWHESLYSLWHRQALDNINIRPERGSFAGHWQGNGNVPRCFKKLVLIVAWVGKWHSLTTLFDSLAESGAIIITCHSRLSVAQQYRVNVQSFRLFATRQAPLVAEITARVEMCNKLKLRKSLNIDANLKLNFIIVTRMK